MRQIPVAQFSMGNPTHFLLLFAFFACATAYAAPPAAVTVKMPRAVQDQPVDVLRVAQAQSVERTEILQPYQTVDLEHQDRKKRLQRLARLDGVPAPEVYEYSIPQSQHGLKDYPVSIPIARVVFRDKVFFDFDHSDLKREALPIINTIIDTLRHDPPDVTVFVVGHTDAVGTWEYNQSLGLKRAKAVATALAREGIQQAQVYLVSFGKAVPLASNSTEDGRARNRRVEFLFAAQAQPIAAWLARQRTVVCMPQSQGQIEACPHRIKVTGVKLELAKRPEQVVNKTTSVETKSKPTVEVIESTKVDMDLTLKTFSFRAPE